MNTNNNHFRILGAAFLLQAVASLISGAVLLQPLVSSNSIIETMTNFSNHMTQVRASIVLDTITALGIIFLGALLFIILRRQNEKMALIAFGFYMFEASLLAVSKIFAYTLLHISQESALAGHPDYLQAMGSLALNATNFAYTLHLLPFCLGAIMFYYLLYKAQVIPTVLSLWGLITVLPLLFGTMYTLLTGNSVSIILYLPYVPFEFFVGLWILVRGIQDSPISEQQLAPA